VTVHHLRRTWLIVAYMLVILALALLMVAWK
jgi:hypothetical protein